MTRSELKALCIAVMTVEGGSRGEGLQRFQDAKLILASQTRNLDACLQESHETEVPYLTALNLDMRLRAKTRIKHLIIFIITLLQARENSIMKFCLANYFFNIRYQQETVLYDLFPMSDRPVT
jgi:hypothetical protein